MNSLIGNHLIRFSRSTVLATNGLLALADEGVSRAAKPETVASKARAKPEEVVDVLSRLEKAGILEREASDASAFRLRRDPGAISLLDVARAVDERFDGCRFLEADKPHGQAPQCKGLEKVAEQVEADIVALFRSRTIGELMTAYA